MSCLDLAASRTEAAQAWRRFHQEMLTLRAREIVPRLRGLRPGGTDFELLGAEALRVHWRLGDGSHLTLLANLGSKPVSGIAKPCGNLLTAVPAHRENRFSGQLPAWSVWWFLEPSS